MDRFEWHSDSPDALMRSQSLDAKRQNYDFAILKGMYFSEQAIAAKTKRAYNCALKKIEIGKSEDVYAAVNQDIRVRSRMSKVKRFGKFLKKLIRKKWRNSNRQFLL